MFGDIDWQTLDRYLAGDASPDEVARVRDWMDSSPDRQRLVETLAEHARTSTPVNVDAAWRVVATRTVSAPTPLRKPERSVRPRWVASSGTAQWLAAAAVVVLLVGVPVLWRRRLSIANQPTVQAATTWREIAAPRGARVSLHLPDGSSVTLNSGSSLRYSPDTTGSSRDVYLRGEGYFVVKHDAAHPFEVHANNASVRDVGTRFVVRAYDAQSGTVVVVADGAVNFKRDTLGARDSVLVTRGVLARMTATGSISTTLVDPAAYVGFTDGRLVLDGITLGAAVPMLERWYGADIRLTDSSLANRRVMAEFRGETLTEALQALAVALDLAITRRGQSFAISTALHNRRP